MTAARRSTLLFVCVVVALVDGRCVMTR